jgi:hypothetical protein
VGKERRVGIKKPVGGRKPRRHRVVAKTVGAAQLEDKRRVTEVVAGPVQAPAKRLVNRIAIVMDESRSMARLKQKGIEYLNEQINRIKNEASERGQCTEISVLCFSSYGSRWLYQNAYFQTVGFVGQHDYMPERGGDTPLMDSVEDAVRSLLTKSVLPGDDMSYLVMTLTDGQENCSTRNRPANFSSMLRSYQSLGNWTFAFAGPAGSKYHLKQLGVPEGNIQEWEVSEAGLRDLSAMTASAGSGYFAGRAKGLRASMSFYSDASKLTTVKANQVLENVTGDFKSWKVEKGEVEIKPFVESKGYAYVAGAGFYQLTKREEVQDYKELLIRHKQTKRLYGGDNAKQLLGLPASQTGTIKLNPGNHGDWDVFVSSKSTNRKLVRGTDLLYRVK